MSHTKFNEAISKMPPLQHSSGESFDIAKSEFARWLIQQPEVLQFLCDKARNSGYVRFDPDTRLWSGCIPDKVTRPRGKSGRPTAENWDSVLKWVKERGSPVSLRGVINEYPNPSKTAIYENLERMVASGQLRKEGFRYMAPEPASPPAVFEIEE